MGFEPGLPVGMVLGSLVGFPLGYPINMLLGLSLFNSFGIWEGYLVEVSINTLVGLMIGTGERSLVVLSLELPRVSPLESPNPGADLSGTLLGSPLGLWFGSEVFWEVGISCVPPYGALITYKMTSVRYFQLQELLNLSLSPTLMISTSGGR